MTKFNRVFDESCRTEKGKLTIPELKVVLQREGIYIEDTAFFALCESFDPDRDGRFANPEFVVLMAYVQSCQATFAAFDPQRSGTITMNFGQVRSCQPLAPCQSVTGIVTPARGCVRNERMRAQRSGRN